MGENIYREPALIKELEEKVEKYKKQLNDDEKNNKAIEHRISQTMIVIEGLKEQLKKKMKMSN